MARPARGKLFRSYPLASSTAQPDAQAMAEKGKLLSTVTVSGRCHAIAKYQPQILGLRLSREAAVYNCAGNIDYFWVRNKRNLFLTLPLLPVTPVTFTFILRRMVAIRFEPRALYSPKFSENFLPNVSTCFAKCMAPALLAWPRERRTILWPIFLATLSPSIFLIRMLGWILMKAPISFSCQMRIASPVKQSVFDSWVSSTTSTTLIVACWR